MQFRVLEHWFVAQEFIVMITSKGGGESHDAEGL